MNAPRQLKRRRRIGKSAAFARRSRKPQISLRKPEHSIASSAACSHVRGQDLARDSPPGSNRSKCRCSWCPKQEAGPKDAGLTSSHARVGYRIAGVSSRSCLGLGASVGRYDRLITGHEGSPPDPASSLGRLQNGWRCSLSSQICGATDAVATLIAVQPGERSPR
jgi:hypothetical protein